MVDIGIVIEQLDVPGEPGVSRDDIVIGSEITLKNHYNGGVTEWEWKIIDKPVSSVAVLRNATEMEAYFTPDVVGSYLIQLLLNGRVKQRVIAAVLTETLGLRIPAAGEAFEFEGGSLRAISNSISVLEENSGGGGGGGGGGSGYGNNILISVPLTLCSPYSNSSNSLPQWSMQSGFTGWKIGQADSPSDYSNLQLDWDAFPNGYRIKNLFLSTNSSSYPDMSLFVGIYRERMTWTSMLVPETELEMEDTIFEDNVTITSGTKKLISVGPFSSNNDLIKGDETTLMSDRLYILFAKQYVAYFNIMGIYIHLEKI